MAKMFISYDFSSSMYNIFITCEFANMGVVPYLVHTRESSAQWVAVGTQIADKMTDQLENSEDGVAVGTQIAD